MCWGRWSRGWLPLRLFGVEWNSRSLGFARDDKGERGASMGDWLVAIELRIPVRLRSGQALGFLLVTTKSALSVVVSNSSQKRLEWGTQPSLPSLGYPPFVA